MMPFNQRPGLNEPDEDSGIQWQDAATPDSLISMYGSMAESGPAATDNLGYSDPLASVGRAVGGAYSRVMEGPVGQALDEYEQQYMRPYGVAGSLVRGAVTGDFQDLRRIAETGRYEPGDVTGNQWVDMVVSAIADPSTFMPGFGPAGAGAKTMGIASQVRAPGALIAAALRQAPTPPRKLPVTEKGNVSHVMTARQENIRNELGRRLASDEGKQRLAQVMQRGLEAGGDTWYKPEVIVDFFKQALGPLRREGFDPDTQATELFNVFAMMNAVTSGNTGVSSQLDRAMILLDRIHRGETFDEILTAMRAADDAGTPLVSKTFGTTHKAALFNEAAIRNALETGEVSSQKMGTFFSNYLGFMDGVTVDTHNIRQILYVAGLDYRNADDRVEIARLFGFSAGSPEAVREWDAKKFRNALYNAAAQTSNYSAVEDVQKNLAQQMGISPRDFQAVLWVGAADITGVQSTLPFSQIFMNRMKIYGKRIGVEPGEVIRKLVKGELPFADVLGGSLDRLTRRVASQFDPNLSEEEVVEPEDWSEDETGAELAELLTTSGEMQPQPPAQQPGVEPYEAAAQVMGPRPNPEMEEPDPSDDLTARWRWR